MLIVIEEVVKRIANIYDDKRGLITGLRNHFMDTNQRIFNPLSRLDNLVQFLRNFLRTP